MKKNKCTCNFSEETAREIGHYKGCPCEKGLTWSQEKDKIEKILNFSIMERNLSFKNTVEFNQSDDEYKQGYWMAMNTIIDYIENLK